MWLRQMVYVEVILGVQIQWSTIPHTNTNLKVACRSKVIPNSMLSQNASQPIPLVWKPSTNPPTVQAHFDFFPFKGDQPFELHAPNT